MMVWRCNGQQKVGWLEFPPLDLLSRRSGISSPQAIALSQSCKVIASPPGRR